MITCTQIEELPSRPRTLWLLHAAFITMTATVYLHYKELIQREINIRDTIRKSFQKFRIAPAEAKSKKIF